ncbi:hypothetical protein KI387_042436 [Taxus chinensis]|uniref:Uncharacterized protein n=1 Tax=Taxus chinensis TaxID=29808 RepID=A0AA38F4Z0_TAXCH|nr:hypothetical protein KI387_042436 [Taxus chinensis]
MTEVADINLVRISTVKPAVLTESKRMFLPALDLLWCIVSPVERILFYNISCSKFDAIVERLKSSLSTVLVHFYPLAGRLASGDQQNRLEIDCNDRGVPFVEAYADLNFSDLQISKFESRPIFKRLVPASLPDEKDDQLLLSVQVTSIHGGGICIGTRLNHVVADGNSYWHFMQSWAECCRGAPISRYPEHKRYFFKLSNTSDNVNNTTATDNEFTFDGSKHAQSKTDKETQQLQSQMPSHENESSDTKPLNSNQMSKSIEESGADEKGNETRDLICKTFHFSKEMIQKQKARAEKHGNQTFSSFVVVAAHFWRCMVKAREIPDEEPVYFFVLVDSRNRVNPPLSPAYFGNCIQIAASNATARELLSQTVSFASGLIKEAVNRCTEKNLMSMINWVESNVHSMDAEINSIRERYIVNVVSSPRFPVYEVDYGWGKPLNVQAAAIDEIGAMVLFPGREGGGTIDITTCLPLSQMDVFHSLFMEDINSLQPDE